MPSHNNMNTYLFSQNYDVTILRGWGNKQEVNEAGETNRSDTSHIFIFHCRKSLHNA